ncbi:unnamed protein product [Paramecium octaurelia]|uniref:Uncharacterized protein n=1 Tax=Paramecium octaurelia TaxID=43137 RepID=A0A8S1TCB1_PAROT|nr:unnamed protein product [Paramecium octaurelia]
MQQFYDTDLQSEHPPSDILSEKDIPKEKLHKQKMLVKKELLHVKKEVRQRGISYEKPAYYDKVKIAIIEITEEEYNNGDEKLILENAKIVEQHILSPQNDRWIDKALQSMKKQEISIYIQEHLKHDENQMKVLDYKVYTLIQMIDWQIIVDLFQDQTYLKYILQLGKGGDRCEILDEIIYEIKIFQGENLLFTDSQDGPSPIKLIKSKVVYQILKTMKNKELSLCHIKHDSYLQNENQEFLQSLNYDKEAKVDWKVEINVKTLFKIDDLYGDGILIKTTMYRSRNTAKPDKVSLIDFDMWIYSMSTDPYPKKENLLYSSTDEDPIYDRIEAKKHNDEDEEPSQGSLSLYIDDLKVSKLMRLALLRMKKRELSIIRCYETKDLIKNGIDYEGMKGMIEKELIYVIYVHTFSEGKNNFSMTIDEKIEQAIRKKQIGLKWISQQNYRKALKVFKTINAYFDYGTFTEDDKEKMREFQISSLLNSSLCMMKLKEWKDMKIVCEKLYKLDSKNQKVVYRYCYALMNLYEYEEALQIITEDNEDLIKLKMEIKQLYSQYKNKEKQMYQKWLS